MNTNGQIQLSQKVLEISFSDLLKWYDFPKFEPVEIYCILMNFRFFNNIHSSDHTVDLESIGYNDFKIDDLDLRFRDKCVLAKLKIKTFQELINYPSESIRITRMSGIGSIDHLKSVIIETIVKIYSIKGFPEKMKGIELVTPHYLYEFENRKLRYYEYKKNKEKGLVDSERHNYDNPRYFKSMAACTARVAEASHRLMLGDLGDSLEEKIKALEERKKIVR